MSQPNEPLTLNQGPAASLLEQLNKGKASDALSGKQRVRLNFTHAIVESAFRAVLDRNPATLIETLNELEERSTPDMTQQYLVASIIAVGRSLLIASGDFTPPPEPPDKEAKL